MEFKYLTAKEFEALTEYQQEKYLDEKRKHEEKVAKEAAEKAAAAAAEKAIAEFKEKSEKETQDKIDAAVKVVKDESDTKLEKALADMNRAKEYQKNERKKTLGDQIEEFLFTEEGEKQLKEMSTNKEALNFEIKAPGTISVPAGSVAEQWAPNALPAYDAVHARNVIPVSPTQSNAIKYNRFSIGPDGNLINSVAPGALKPQLDYIITPETANVVKIAGWVQLHDEAMDDIVGMRSFLASALPEAYLEVEDLKVFKGQGGADIEGIMEVAGTVNYADFGGIVTAASNNWDKLAASLTQIVRNRRRATAIWTSPEDYLSLLINKDNQEAYTYPVIMDSNGILRIGGVPIFQHNVFDQGEALTGDFLRGARIFQRQAINVRYSREHANNFTTNQTTVLVEARIALPIYYPDAFVVSDLTAA